MANAGTVNVNLVAETSKFHDNMRKAALEMESFSKRSRAADKASAKAFTESRKEIDKFSAGSKSIDIMGASITKFIGAASGIGAVAFALRGVFNEASRLRNISNSTGLAAGEIVKLEQSAIRSGVSVETMTQAMMRMNVVIGESMAGNAEASKNLERIGVSADELFKLSPAERFQRIGSAIGNITDGAQRAASAAKILGESGAKLVGMFSGSSFGDALVDQSDIDRINRATNALTVVTSQAGGFFSTIKTGMMVKLGTAADFYLTKLGAISSAHKAFSMDAEASFVNVSKAAEESAKRQKDAQDYVNYQAKKADETAKSRQIAYESIVKIEEESSAAIIEIKSSEIGELERIDNERSAKLQALHSLALKHNLENTVGYKEAELAIHREAEERVTQYKRKAAIDQREILDQMQASSRRGIAAQLESWSAFFDNVKKKQKEATDEQNKWAGMSPADDPAVKAKFLSNQLNGDAAGRSPAVAARLKAIAEERIAIEQGLGIPFNSEELKYKRKVQLLSDEMDIKNNEEEKKRLEMQAQEKRALYSNFFGDLATIAGAFADQSREMFIVSKVASIAQAEVNAWMAYSNIMANASKLDMGTGYSQIMATTALIAGQVAVMNIAKQQPPGRATGGAVSRNSLYEVAEKGPEILESKGRTYLLNGDSSGRVQPMGPGGGRGVIVNVNNLPGQTARVTDGGTPDNPSVNIDIIDNMVASAVSQPRSATSRALQNRYGLNAARGAG